MAVQLAQKVPSGPGLRCCIAALGTLGQIEWTRKLIPNQRIVARPNRVFLTHP
jgi:hypothetical protein